MSKIFQMAVRRGWMLVVVVQTIAIAEAQQVWNRVDPSQFTFEQASLNYTNLSDPSGNRAVRVTATFRITNNTGESFDGARWVWPWGIGYHLYTAGEDQIFERRWDEALGQFVFYGQDAWYDGQAGVSMTPEGIDGLMAMADTNLSAASDAENYDWLGVDLGAVPATSYPGVSVDPNSNVPYYDVGTIAPGASTEFSYGALLEYPNDPVPNQVGFYGLAELVVQVPEPAVSSMLMFAGVFLLRRRCRMV